MALLGVTVLVTVFGRTAYIGAAIRIAAEQVGVLTEIIVLDDSASPQIQMIVESLNLPNVKYHANKCRIGVSKSIFQGILLAKHDHISILNDDDVWETDFLQRLLVPAATGKDVCLWFADHWIADEAGNNIEVATNELTAKSGRASLPRGLIPNIAELLLETGGLPIAQAAVFRRSFLNIPEDAYKAGSSYDFFISVLLACSSGCSWYSSDRASSWRQHPQMETRRADPMRPLEAVYALNIAIRNPAFAAYTNQVAGWIYRLEKSAIKLLINNGNITLATRVSLTCIARRIWHSISYPQNRKDTLSL